MIIIHAVEWATDASLFFSGILVGGFIYAILSALMLPRVYISRHTEGTKAEAIRILGKDGETVAIYVTPGDTAADNVGLFCRVNRWLGRRESLILIKDKRKNIQVFYSLVTLAFFIVSYAIYQIFNV